GAVALPQLGAVAAFVGREEQRAAHVDQVGGFGAGGARSDVLDHDGAGGSSVRLPQLEAVAAVVGRGDQRAADDGRVVREAEAVAVGVEGGCGARSDILDEYGAGGGAVALPQLDAVAAVVGLEEQGAADRGQVGGVGTVGAGVEVVDEG